MNHNGFGNGVLMGVLILVLLFVIFLICREIICWYWKINKAISLLEIIAENTSLPVEGSSLNTNKDEKGQS